MSEKKILNKKAILPGAETELNSLHLTKLFFYMVNEYIHKNMIAYYIHL